MTGESSREDVGRTADGDSGEEEYVEEDMRCYRVGLEEPSRIRKEATFVQ
jgi:hypothetical protein